MMGVCSRCNKQNRIYAKGLCMNCYWLIKRNKFKTNETNKRWRERNPDYFRNYHERKEKEELAVDELENIDKQIEELRKSKEQSSV